MCAPQRIEHGPAGRPEPAHFFHTRNGVVRAVNGVSFQMEPGETLGIVGESGSGKSVTCYSMMRLLPEPPARIESGSANFQGVDLLHCPKSVLRGIRGKKISMIFQDPMTSLNPYMRIEDQLIEPLLIHERISREAAVARAIAMLKEVGVPDAVERIQGYPHQFSGGMRQRVMIAVALITAPDLLIADEPTTALDVTTQAQILTLMKRLQDEFGSAIMIITHDLGVVAETADDVLVMYAANVVEQADVNQLFGRPQHPYTWGLMGSLPRLETDVERLTQIPGQPPSLLRPPAGCRFLPRCPHVMEVCKTTVPELVPTQKDQEHLQACHLDEETKDREAAKLLEVTMAAEGAV